MGMNKEAVKRFLIMGLAGAVILGLLLLFLYKAAFDPYRGSARELTPSLALTEPMPVVDALEDLSYIRRMIRERHPAAMEGLPPAMAEAYEREEGWLAGQEEVTVAMLWQSAARLLTPLQDAHTRAAHYAEEVPVLPVSFEFREGQLLARGSGLAGQEVRLVSGVPAEALYQTFQGHFSHELEGYLRFMFARNLSRQDYQILLDVPVDEPSLTLADGRKVPLNWQVDPPAGETGPASGSAPAFVRYDFDEDLSLGIFTLDSCRMNDEYQAAVEAFFQEVKDRGIRHLVVDLRRNSGGNSMVVGEFLRYIDVPSVDHGGTKIRMGPLLLSNDAFTARNPVVAELKFRGPIDILTSPYTFSAAVDFATTFADNGLARIVGQTPGNMPASYGDIIGFQTPHARLYFSVSYKYFMRSEEALNGEPLFPDLEVPEGEALAEVKRLIRQGE